MGTLRVLILLVALSSTAYGAHVCVVPAESNFKIHVASAGLFGAFGHDHLIEARGIKGCADVDTDRMDQSSIQLTFSTADIKVLDPEHPGDRPKVQQTMESEVLKTQQFPEITFKSAQVRVQKEGAITIDGALTIRGQTQNVSIPVTVATAQNGQMKARGRYALKQSTFGIKPIQLMGGTVRVKDEMQIGR